MNSVSDKSDRLCHLIKEWHIIVLLIFAVFALRIVSLSAHPIPYPRVTDEFAYILAAKTFAAGKITNQPHELQEFFDTRHVLSSPTVMSKYQPGTALLMAAFYHISGDYYWGVVAASAMMIAAIYWAMRGWCGRLPSLIIALVFLLVTRAPHYFTDSYWGGALPFAACFIMIGAYPRIVYQQRDHLLAIASAGLIIGFSTRPLESALCAVVLLISGLIRRLRHDTKQERAKLLKTSALVIILMLLPFALFQLYYNNRVTGNPLLVPYALYSSQYQIYPFFYGQKTYPELVADNPLVSSWQQHEGKYYNSIAAFGPLKNMLLQFSIMTPDKFIEFFKTAKFVQPDPHGNILYQTSSALIMAIVIFTPLLLIYCAIIYQACYMLLFGLLVGVVVNMFRVPFFPHYLSMHMAFFVVAIVMMGKIFIRQSKNKALSQLFFAFCGMCALILSSHNNSNSYSPSNNNKAIENRLENGKLPEINREQKSINLRKIIDNGLTQTADKHLIFVNHLPEIAEDKTHVIWIYNEPDIKNSKIIWARDISPSANAALINMYPERKIWYVEPYIQRKLIAYDQRQ